MEELCPNGYNVIAQEVYNRVYVNAYLM